MRAHQEVRARRKTRVQPEIQPHRLRLANNGRINEVLLARRSGGEPRATTRVPSVGDTRLLLACGFGTIFEEAKRDGLLTMSALLFYATLWLLKFDSDLLAWA